VSGGSGIPPSLVIVGPVHPLGGGVAQHVARLAGELFHPYEGAVAVESWKSQYPTFLHRSQITVDDTSQELPLVVPVVRKLAWYSPLSWASAGARNRSRGVTVFNVVTPFHAIPFAVMGLFLGRAALRVAIVHNALPHERTVFDRILLRLLVLSCDAFIVHDTESEALIEQISQGRKQIVELRLPDPWQFGTSAPAPPQGSDESANLAGISALFFGNVRPYKGLSVLLEALRDCPHVSLTVAGNFWNQEESIARMVQEWGLTDRVTLLPGYVDRDDIPGLFGRADVVVLPYISGTASVIPQMAFSYGTPVIATDVGSIAAGVHDGVNGLVVKANSSRELAQALSTFSENSRIRENLTSGARRGQSGDGWETYVRELQKLFEQLSRRAPF
jgi:glycosyltransferase involved in cell wall biosynthesis